jgi:manganese/zinc/iron transport system substrate-binding protein
MLRQTRWHFGLYCLISGLLAGCTSTVAGPTEATRLKRVVATTGMVADLVRIVGGERCEVTALIGSGVDPHLYKPTRADVKRLLEADVVFYSGLHLEGRMTEALVHLQRGGKPVVAITESLGQSRLRAADDAPGFWDPHVWMDVSLWSQCLPAIVQTLSELDPVHAGEFQSRADELRIRLDNLDAKIAAAIWSIPEPQRVLITAHDAFGYFSQRYGIEVRSIQGVSTESEAGVGDVNQLVEFVVSRRVPAIFVESSVNSKTVEAVQEGAQSRGFAVRIGAELFSDAMGPPGSYEGTYLGMMDANATRIARALGGDVAERGFFGQLTVEE